jgi:two-component system sensor histidine kinase YesM
MVDPGVIKIKAEIKEDNLFIYVIDNGEGMSPETLKNIWNSKSKNSGVGIKNVNERIQLLFGKEYGLSFESEREEGTTVTIKLPIVKGESENEA